MVAPKKTDPQAWEAKRREILDASLRVFSSRGLAGTRITDLAEAAGTSPALLYHYFADKEAVFATLVEEALSSSQGSFQLAAALPEPPAVQLWFLLDFIFRHAYQGGGKDYFLLMIQAGTASGLPESLTNKVDQEARRYADLLVPILVRGQALGQVRPAPPEALFTLVITLIQGFAVVRAFRDWAPPPPPTDLLVAGLLTPEGLTTVGTWQANGGPARAQALLASYFASGGPYESPSP